jgi:DNA-directed RNA polymerase subunit M/transcription elongation factor TFIIS
MPAKLGKLKRTLKENCPECGEMLELRTQEKTALKEGVSIFLSVDCIMCPLCGYVRKKEQKRNRRFQNSFEYESKRGQKKRGNLKNKYGGGYNDSTKFICSYDSNKRRKGRD